MKRCRKGISLFLVCCMLVSMLPITAMAVETIASGACGGEGDGTNLTWTLTTDGVLTIDGRGIMKNYADSSETVPWNNYKADIVEVSIGSEVTSIGGSTFSGCINLLDITIPDSVKSIGKRAFNGSGLTRITIPGSVTSMGWQVFGFCDSLKNVVFLDGITDIGKDTFSNCSSLENVTIPNSVTKIEEQVFYECRNLKSIVISENIVSVGNRAFDHCISLESVIIPSGVIDLGGAIFIGCSGLKNVVFLDGAENIGKEMFYGCSGLAEITIPDSVTTIEVSAFLGCSGLKDVYYYGTEEEWNKILIDTGNDSLLNATIHFLGEIPVSGIKLNSSNLILEGINEEEQLSATIYPENATNQDVIWASDAPNVATVDEGLVKAISEGNTKITATTVDGGYSVSCDVVVLSMSVVASGYCGGEGDGTNLEWTLDADGILTITGKGSMADWGSYINTPWSNWRGEIEKITIYEGVTNIGSGAFGSCGMLKDNVSIPDSVVSIGSNAFKGCIRLTNIVIPDGIIEVGREAFADCTQLTEIDLPDNLVHIPSGIFNSCSNLTLVEIPDGVKSIGDSAFSFCSSLTYVDLPDSITSIGNRAFNSCKKMEVINIPETITTISEGLFIECRSLTGIQIPDSITGIGPFAFSNCSGLIDIDIPDSVIEIGHGAFQGCSGLTSIDIPDGITKIDSSTFSDCESLIEVHLPNNLTFIGLGAFARCKNLRDISVPDEVTTLWSFAFESCINLKSIILPDSVVFIRDYAFNECNALETVYYPGSDTQWESIEIWEMNDPLVNANIIFGKCGVRGIEIDQRELSIEEGKTAYVTVSVLPENADNKAVTWTSDNLDVSTVDDGLVTAVAEGKTKITATTVDGGYSVSCDVTVYPVTVDIVAASNILEGGTAHGSGAYRKGQSITVTAYPNSGFVFRGWREDGVIISTDPQYYLIASSDRTLTAVFEKLVDVAVSGVPAEGGTVSGSGAYQNGENVMVTATVNPGYIFKSWQENGQVVFTAPEYAFVAEENRALTAVFEKTPSYTLKYDANGAYGSVPSGGTALKGTEFSVAEQGGLRKSGYEFVGWNTKANATGIAYQPGGVLTLNSDITLYAQWRVTNCTVNGEIKAHKADYAVITVRLDSMDGVVYMGTVGEGISESKNKTMYPYTVNAPQGRYTLYVIAITADGVQVTRSKAVTLTDEPVTVEINLPDGQAKQKSEVKVEKDAPQVLAGGLDVIVDQEVSENPDIKAVDVTLVVQAVEETSQEAAKIQEQVLQSDPTLQGNEKLEFVELTVEKEVTNQSGDTNKEQLHELADSIQIVIPFDRSGRNNIQVHRYHEGNVDTLTTTPNQQGEYIEIFDNYIVIHSKKFSTYAIGYKESESPEQPEMPETPNVPDQPEVPSTLNPPSVPNPPSSSHSSSGNYGYHVSLAGTISGGKVTLNRKIASKGSEVTITITPDAGYELSNLTVTDTKGATLELTDKGGNQFTFIMPSGKVEVSAVFQPIPSGDTWKNDFSDVTADSWYYDAVIFAVQHGIMSGYSKDEFAPDDTLSRAMFAQILYNLERKPAVSSRNSFSDVAADSWYVDAVLWASEKGIVSGYGNGVFGSDDPITREHLALMLYKYAGTPAQQSHLSQFADTGEISDYARHALEWAVERKVLSGMGNGMIFPKTSANRAQVAQIFKNFLEQVP